MVPFHLLGVEGSACTFLNKATRGHCPRLIGTVLYWWSRINRMGQWDMWNPSLTLISEFGFGIVSYVLALSCHLQEKQD